MMALPGDPRTSAGYRKAVFLMWKHWEEDGRGTMCHLCGHQGATEADHLDPIAGNPWQAPHWSRLKPAHGVNPRAGHPGPCSHPDCLAANNGVPRACNQLRGKGALPNSGVQPTYTTRRW